MTLLLFVAVAVLILNLPFGYWRAGVRRYSLAWFLSIHIPVPFVVALRLMSGLGFHLATLPLVVGAYVAGQLLGGVIRRKRP
jgi:hypothetical protein